VSVFEEHKRIGEPCRCSGLISRNGLEALAHDVDYRKTVLNWFDSADISTGGAVLHVRAANRDRKAFAIDRSLFDRLCAEKAEQEGAKFVLGKKTRAFRCGHVIGADGAMSGIARDFGFPRIRRFISTLQVEAKYKAEDPHSVEVFLSPSEFPGFFGWVIPLDEESAKIGVGVRIPHSSKKALDILLRKKGIGKHAKLAAGLIPAEVRAKTAGMFANCGVLLCGDAAGQVKATTGGGVYFGCSCAKLAGIHAADPLKYESEWRKRYGGDLALHSAIRGSVDMGGGPGLWLGSHAAKLFGLEGFLSKFGDMDSPTRMIERARKGGILGI
jgi:flavin-dependent dehydrogenase